MAHSHDIIDKDIHFVIDPLTRKIEPEDPAKKKLIKGDHDSERFTFEIPRMIENHDMSLCDIVRVHFLNTGDRGLKSQNVYEPVDVAIDPDDSNTVRFSWLISHHATAYAGTLSFAVQFACLAEDGEEITYAWNTAIYTGIIIADTYDFGESVIDDYYDVIEQWKHEMELAYGDLEDASREIVVVSSEMPLSRWTHVWVDPNVEINEVLTREDLEPIVADIAALKARVL